jgi:16S rRNA (adenine1518-N6/adenine1519-N6)-dimethyltransferase
VPGYRAKKRLGQNFLTSQAFIDRIVALVDTTQQHPIIEVGPGRGALTLPLAGSGNPLYAVEFDNDLLPYLHKLFEDHRNVRLIQMDFLEFEPSHFDIEDFILVGNLPYNISSPVLDWCVAHRNGLTQAVLMLQKEVAERVSSRPESKGWSPLAIFTQLYFKVATHFNIAAANFKPRPQVASTVITLTPARKVDIPYPQAFETVVRTAFRHRRKLLTNNLVPTVIPDQHVAVAVFEQLGWEKNTRAEELPTEMFLELTRLLVDRKIIEVRQ